MWLPDTMGGSAGLVPSRRMKTLPILSTVMLRPAALPHDTTRSRPCLSRSVSARRLTPPLGVAPMRASSISEFHRRSPLIVSTCVSTAAFMYDSLGVQRATAVGACCCLKRSSAVNIGAKGGRLR
ncbi:hypothetical protein FQZ97_1002250 [compost metagenome]